jgi:hypothetical protein
LGRFLHHAQVVAITGKSYRVKQAPAIKGETKKPRLRVAGFEVPSHGGSSDAR